MLKLWVCILHTKDFLCGDDGIEFANGLPSHGDALLMPNGEFYRVSHIRWEIEDGKFVPVGVWVEAD